MFNAPLTFPIDNFSLGWDNISKPTTMEEGSFKEIKNFNITKHGGIDKRGGMTKLYPTNVTDQVNACDATTDWTGTVLTNDTTDKEEGTGSLKDTVAVPVATTNYTTLYNPAGTWNWSTKKHLLFWLKSDRANTAFTFARFYIWEGANYRYWNLTFSAGEWTAIRCLLSTGDGESGTPPDLALVGYCYIRFKAADTTPFYKKIDDVRVDYDSPITSFYEYNAPDKNAYNLVAIGTKIKAFYEAAWHDLKTGLTADKKYSFATHLGLCYGVNGVDPNFKLYNNTAYQVGITPPVAAPAVLKISPGSDSKVEEYAETNQDNCGELRQHADRTSIAQAFILDEDADLTKVKLSFKKVGTITAGKKVWVEIHSDKTGTQVGGDSGTKEANDIAVSFTNYELEFTGTKPSLSKNTTYYLVIYGDFTVSSTNFIVAGFDNSSPAYDSTKKYWEIDGSSAWTDYPSVDLVFEIYAIITTGIELKSSGILETGYSDTVHADTTFFYSAQSFKVDEASKLTSVKLPLKRTLFPPGATVWVEIHSDKVGTQVGGDSDTKDKDDIDLSDFEWIEFDFSGTKPSLSGATTYYLILYASWTPLVTNRWINWTRTQGGGIYDDGQQHTIKQDTSWIDGSEDFSFKIFGYATAGTKVKEYALGNIDIVRSLRETTSQTLMAQSFQITEESTVPRLKLWLSKVGSPTGNVWVEIHDGRDGTSGTKNASTYKVGEASSNVDIATGITGAFPTYGWVEFTFAGVEPSLVQGRTYYIVLYGSATVSTTDYVSVGMDKIDPQYASGIGWNVDNGSPMVWTAFEHVDLMFELYMTTGGLTGDYKHKYCYKRTGFADLISNPSEASDLTQPSTQNMRVSLIASTDPQVDKIILYRTLDGSDPDYYKAVELPNTTATYDDAFADGSLTTLLKEDNTAPPKAKFVIVHKDRVFYVNCPDEESGGALVRWSKTGIGESCPLSNYQYFDRDDGRDITGVASLWDNFIVFKKDKIGVLAGDLSNPSSCEISYLSLGIGCIASWAILPLEDKILFLSEEGWKATDGTDIFNISSKINGLIKDGYISINQNENYSVAYYPEKEQFHFLMNHSTLDPMVAVGHFLIPLMLAAKGIIGISEKALGNIVGWTPHQYDNHALTCVGNYTDGDGITRVIAGSDDGYVYLLDSGADDDGSNIHVRLRTDWLSLGRRKTHTKVTRRGRLVYSTDGTINMELQEDVDFEAGGDPTTFTGADRGIDDALNKPFDLAGTGELFRYTLSEISSQQLSINALEIKLRDMGAR